MVLGIKISTITILLQGKVRGNKKLNKRKYKIISLFMQIEYKNSIFCVSVFWSKRRMPGKIHSSEMPLLQENRNINKGKTIYAFIWYYYDFHFIYMETCKCHLFNIYPLLAILVTFIFIFRVSRFYIMNAQFPIWISVALAGSSWEITLPLLQNKPFIQIFRWLYIKQSNIFQNLHTFGINILYLWNMGFQLGIEYI